MKLKEYEFKTEPYDHQFETLNLSAHRTLFALFLEMGLGKSKILLDKQSPYLKSLIINKGQKNGVKLGSAVKDRLYYIGKVVNVNLLSSRVLLANDLNSKIPIIIEPSGINAILSGNGNES